MIDRLRFVFPNGVDLAREKNSNQQIKTFDSTPTLSVQILIVVLCGGSFNILL